MAITAPLVNAKVEDHFTKHADVYDPLIKKHEILLLGEGGDNGICKDVNEIKNGFKTIKSVGVGIIIVVGADLATRLMSIVK